VDLSTGRALIKRLVDSQIKSNSASALGCNSNSAAVQFLKGTASQVAEKLVRAVGRGFIPGVKLASKSDFSAGCSAHT
jgi:hypothetical protein